MPSQSTEEWRYTDLSTFELDHRSVHRRCGPEDVNRHGVLAAAGRGERAGLQIQRNSQVISTQRATGLVDKGVVFGDLDEAAAEHPDLVERYLHDLVPTRPYAVHGAARGVPHRAGRSCYVPRDSKVDAAAADPDVRRRRRRGGLPAHADRGGGRRRGDVHRPVRLARPRSARFSDAITEIYVGDGAHVRYAAIQDWGAGVTHLGVQRARVGRDAEFRTLSRGLRRRSRADRDRGPAGRARRVQRACSGCSSPTATQHFDHRSIQDHVALELHERPALQGGAPRREPRRVQRLGLRASRRAEDRRDADEPQHRAVASTPRPTRSRTSRSRRTTCGAATPRASGPSTRRRVFYLQSRGIPRDEAERLIVSGFFQEVLDRVQIRGGA